MNSHKSLEPAIDPQNRPAFLLDWELTMKCNLECTYCGSGLYAGHDNSTAHPPLDQCLSSIDFMYEYVDRMMAGKPKGIQYVNFNVYGGEALHHPDIVTILQEVHSRYRAKTRNWHLTVTTTTNAIIAPHRLAAIIPLIDEFTVSYHTENSNKQKQQFRDNLIAIRDSGRRLKCVVLMHNEHELFQDAMNQIEWLKESNIRCLPRQLDDSTNTRRNYESQEIKWFNKLYPESNIPEDSKINLSDYGRACCGGRSLCLNGNQRNRQHYITDNKFTDWYCSVDRFFLYVKQVTGEVFVNKDCKMNYQGEVGPIGHLADTESMLNAIGTTPTIQCKKYNCMCGLCAPKAQDLDTYNTMMRKYEISDNHLL